jgi:hypothetical protein
MKYNIAYRNKATSLNLSPTEIDPSPSTVEGAHSLVERFYALRQEGVGGVGQRGSVTSLAPLPTKKPKRVIAVPTKPDASGVIQASRLTEIR